MWQGYNHIKTNPVVPYPTDKELDVFALKCDLALVTFLTMLLAIYIGLTEWLAAPLIY